MHPNVRRDFPRFGQLYHVDRRLVSPRSARSASERTFKFPDRRIARAPDGLKRDAGAGLTAITLDFHPAVAAVQALPDRWRGLRRPAEAFHSDRPRFSVGRMTRCLWSRVAKPRRTWRLRPNSAASLSARYRWFRARMREPCLLASGPS